MTAHWPWQSNTMLIEISYNWQFLNLTFFLNSFFPFLSDTHALLNQNTSEKIELIQFNQINFKHFQCYEGLYGIFFEIAYYYKHCAAIKRLIVLFSPTIVDFGFFKIWINVNIEIKSTWLLQFNWISVMWRILCTGNVQSMWHLLVAGKFKNM